MKNKMRYPFEKLMALSNKRLISIHKKMKITGWLQANKEGLVKEIIRHSIPTKK